MSGREVEFEGLTIILVGSFNPAIFHPSWFARHNLIAPEEADDAQVEIVLKNQVTEFSSTWLTVQVTQNKFVFDCNDPTKTQPLADVAIGTFRILEHTPIEIFGLNRQRHIRMKSEEEWHAFGDFYAPKEHWSGVLEKPGLRSLLMEGKREGSTAKTVQVRIEPSTKVPSGVYIHVHEQHKLSEEGPAESTAKFQKELQKSWNPFLAYTESVASQLFAEYDNKTGLHQ